MVPPNNDFKGIIMNAMISRDIRDFSKNLAWFCLLLLRFSYSSTQAVYGLHSITDINTNTP